MQEVSYRSECIESLPSAPFRRSDFLDSCSHGEAAATFPDFHQSLFADTAVSPLESVPVQDTGCNLLRSVSNAIDIPAGSTSPIMIGPPPIIMVRTGTGPPLSTCNDYVQTIDCSSEVDCKTRPVHHFHNCHRLSCCTCFRGTAGIQGRKVAERLNGMAKAYVRAGITPGRPKHLVESKPGLLPESKKNDRKAVKKYIQACIDNVAATAMDGWYGGVYVFHGWRRKGWSRLTHEWETIEDGADDDGKYSPVSKKYIRTQWYWSPHVHFIVYGFFQNEGNYKYTGFIQKVIVSEDDPYESVRKIATYLLTHSGIWLDETGAQVGQAYAYICKFSTRKGGRKFSHKETEDQYCKDPDCKCHLNKWKYQLVDDGKMSMEDGVPVLDLSRPPDDPLKSWDHDPHDIMHGWSSEPYIIERKVYVYLLAGEKPLRPSPRSSVTNGGGLSQTADPSTGAPVEQTVRRTVIGSATPFRPGPGEGIRTHMSESGAMPPSLSPPSQKSTDRDCSASG